MTDRQAKKISLRMVFDWRNIYPGPVRTQCRMVPTLPLPRLVTVEFGPADGERLIESFRRFAAKSRGERVLSPTLGSKLR